MKRNIILLASVITVIIVSCYYDSEEALYPSLSSACDTLNVTFSGTVAPLLNNNCYSCHSNATASSFGNNIKLENYADVKTNAVAVKGSINFTGTYSHMPKNGAKLRACSLRQFDIWVSLGMLNN